MNTRFSCWSVAVGAVALLGGCATSGTGDAPAGDRHEDAVLIMASDAYELHYRAGAVLLVDHGASDSPRDVTTFDEFRELYYVKKDEPAPKAMPSGGVIVNGWRGLDCLRTGDACGAPPAEPPARDVVRLKLLFPQPPR